MHTCWNCKKSKGKVINDNVELVCNGSEHAKVLFDVNGASAYNFCTESEEQK